MSRTRAESAPSPAPVAIMVAIMALVLMGTAALAVDMGQAFTRKREIQYDADRAALAGGARQQPARHRPRPPRLRLRRPSRLGRPRRWRTSVDVRCNRPARGAGDDHRPRYATASTDNGEVFYGNGDPQRRRHATCSPTTRTS